MANKNLGSYFYYALGEILLVVIGIVIALQIDNWNDERIEQRQIREYMLNLVGDIQRDFEMLEPIENQINRAISRADNLDVYMQGKTIDEISNIDLVTYMRSNAYRPFAWNRAALEQIKNSGALRQIKNQQLVGKISEYDALTQHLDQDYNADEYGMQQVESVVMKVVNTNYPNFQEQEIEDFEDDSEEYQYLAFLKSDLCQQIRANDLSMLTSDLNEVISVTNYYSQVISRFSARVDSEIPRLKGFGQEIIALVNAEYK